MFVQEISGDNLSAFEIADQPVLLEFWSPGCGFCKMIAPALEDLAERYLGRVWIAKANVENNSESATRFKVEKLPTLLMIKDGMEVDRLEGGARWEVLNRFIGRYAE